MNRAVLYGISVALVLIILLEAGLVLGQQNYVTLQPNQGFQPIPNTAPALENESTYIGPAPSNLKITVMILPLLKYNKFASYIQELYTPGSPDYHKFLNSYQIYEDFSVSPITPDIISYASQFGISVNATSPLFVVLKGNIYQFEQMFHVKFGMYKYGNMPYFAPTSNVELPADIVSYVSGVLGINNITIAYPNILYLKAEKYANGHLSTINTTTIKISPNQFIGPLPVEQYTPLQIEGAYNMLPLYKLGFLGQGETIAIVDAYGDPAVGYSLDNFSRYSGIPNPPLFNVLYFNATQLPPPNFGWSVETDLDVEYSHTMAPGANILLVYSPYPSNELYEAVAFIVEYHLANIISLSWGAPEYYLLEAGVNITALNEIFMAAAAEGIQVFVSSGDQGVYDALFGIHSINFPSSSPYVTSVGGTALYMSGVSKYINATMKYDFQVGWGDYFMNAIADGYQFSMYYTYAGSGGGESQIFPKPFYQSNLPYTNRTDPDIAMDADPFTGVNVIQDGSNNSYVIYIGVGGTSLAAPLSAGIAAVIDQYYSDTYHETLGFLNPTYIGCTL